ncbi:MAG: Re/Si-specific NAD(P)(+) transhydrogenase subunit alpha [Deltaproteobacteria bacterium]|nr:Re/Si-specific NAD(P)(+) transhydrogenase subunit alpha [Deltaproteobacteria bacterium]
MLIGVPKERAAGERRVAVTPESVRKLIKRGHSLVVEAGAGVGSRATDEAFVDAGATIGTREEIWQAEIVVKIDPPTVEEAGLLREGGKTVSLLYPHLREDVIDALRARKATALALERIPRTSIAQSFDVLSSMANIAGYRAVIEGATELGSFLGLQMTAAGKKPPAKVLVIGAGVAGLAAIGAARALGADVRAFDTRPAVKDEVGSLGAKFLELEFEESGDGGGGYAKVMSKEFIDAEMALFLEQAPEIDIVITTALIPGRKAPLLWTKDHVEAMKPGSVVVDLAAAQGGNCECSEADEVVVHHGVKVLGYTDLVSRMAPDASKFFGNNVVNLLRFMGNGQEEGVIVFNGEDRTINPALSLLDGEDPPELEPLPKKEVPAKTEAATPVAPAEAQPPAPQTLRNGLLSLGAAVALLGLGLNAPTDLLQHMTVFVLACFVGWQVVWNVTAALHTPLMAVTNAISGIILVGGMLQAGAGTTQWAMILGIIAILFASINVVGGFLVTHRMLKMFRKG